MHYPTPSLGLCACLHLGSGVLCSTVLITFISFVDFYKYFIFFVCLIKINPLIISHNVILPLPQHSQIHLQLPTHLILSSHFIFKTQVQFVLSI